MSQSHSGATAQNFHDSALNLEIGMQSKKSRIRETSNLSTDADRRTDTILKRLRDLSLKK